MRRIVKAAIAATVVLFTPNGQFAAQRSDQHPRGGYYRLIDCQRDGKSGASFF